MNSDTKQIGYMILLTMKRFNDLDDVIWTLQMIAKECGNHSSTRTQIALNWLIKCRYISAEREHHDGEAYTTYHITTEGDDAISKASDNPGLDKGYAEWVDRALKGMSSTGRETRLENVVIPSQQFVREPQETIEERLDRKRKSEFHAKRICEKLGVTPEELVEKIKNGKIGLCERNDGLHISWTEERDKQ